MGDSSTAALLEKFQKQIEVHIERMEKLKPLGATQGKTRPLTRVKSAGLLSLPLEILARAPRGLASRHGLALPDSISITEE